MDRQYDVIVFGATGFTGRLVAQYLARQDGHGSPIRWAMAGRDMGKLEQVRKLIGAPASTPLIVADAADAQAMAALVARTRVVLTTVGPYQLYGETLVRACAQAGTDYVDLCGEPAWMADMIPQLQAPAQKSGARIVFSCGFDSIPFDLGVAFLQRAAQQRFKAPLTYVCGRVRVLKGGMSGGTLASAVATIEASRRDPRVAALMAHPFALTPGFSGPVQPEGESAHYDELAKSWTGPFMMAAINTKNVHRTNALLGHAWGKDFLYDERMMTGDGPKGRQRAKKMALAYRVQTALLKFGPARSLLQRFALPKPGEGPDQEAREKGRYEIHFIGQGEDGSTLRAVVTGDRDPGYGSTSKMIAESALCLAADRSHAMAAGGVWTPGAAMGEQLQKRLEERAGLTFSLVAE
ncbi:saccharopine dehydrogenase NADP-binding domain-containing protein [Massilia sp. PAMC28688]|uniref:saccharopine dehydrogenase family protein n=1 Tax=Massilia sp. PAMC28688 TaxID=2861283 RepID=UPI001C6395C6|nr:saccharopine dehydrogenase NADP-binding domain-containing protein [Massilia sp. PAMC28688]QYF93901.1 saccharopine dehydrogenase NADP-binding domain-containing protein [Massilia sp. PAMC28688]